MQPPENGSDPNGLAPEGTPDWEAFYRDYRKPGYIEGFEITTKLGGGMFGLVFRARRMSIGKDYAIKFLKVDDGEVRRAVLSELEQVKYFAQIDHPNLVSIEDRGEVHGIPYLVMAFAGTETLRGKMTASGIGEGEVPKGAEKEELVRGFMQSCRGLHALHERSLVHFDIKPANVFIKGGVARLGDYGLSKLVTHSRGSLSMGRGTPYYMAPEMLQRRGDVRSDIYSLGVMLYEILCGKVPFTGDSEWEVLRKHETARPELPAHLTPVERAVLTRCLAKDPEARFQTVEQLLGAFGPLSRLDGMPVVAAAMPRPAALAQYPPLPSCVPPPLPGQLSNRVAAVPSTASSSGAPPLVVNPAAPPPPPPRRRAAQRSRRAGAGSGSRFGVLAALCVLAVGLFMYISAGGSRQVSFSTIETYNPTPVPMPEPRTLQEAANQQAAKALANGRRAAERNRPQNLREVDFDLVEIPDDFSAYLEVLGPLAKSPRFVPALAVRVERLGRPAMVAAVARLQELNYEDGMECQMAANLQLLLAQMTGVKTLVVSVTGVQPSAREICMFHAVANGWRVIAESYATTEQQYGELLAGSHSVGISVEATSPR
ncbi:MAG: serine/threonine protein kinase [Planctomycetota bacterium]|jgi:serine/threonine protein kinase